MVEFFIRRPIFATVCALLIVLAGAVSVPSIPISLYPQLAPPQVVVTCNFVGANSKDVESAVTTILEQAINGVEGMRYMSSTSSNDGTSAITVTFDTGYSLDIAAVDVQNRVATAQGRLPSVVNATGISITKANANFVLAAGFISPDHSLSQGFISNYIDVYVSDALKRVPGVGAVIIFGERKYAMRLWLDPNRLAARNLTALDVTSSLAEQNVEVAAGQLGQTPSDPRQVYQMAVRVSGRLDDPKQFENLIIKSSAASATKASTSAGSGLVLFKDIGRAELGAENYNTDLRFFSNSFGGGEAIGVGIQQLSNANALDVEKKCLAVLADLQKSYPPGMKGIVAVDTTTVVSDSIKEVEYTIGEAIAIVILVIFLFLQDWRATIIPAVTIPVSLIGTFAFIKVFDFSINSLTLFGITLATGLVVDDAIVVIENVQRHLEEGVADPMEATSIAMREVTSAVIATSLVLISVFVPVSFFPGTTGILYKQFSLTIAFSIAISAFNALTLSPALAGILLRKEQHKTGIMGFFLNPIDKGIKKVISWYAVAVTFVVRIRYAILVLFLASLGATAYMYTTVPTAFVPQEDQGYFLIVIQTPPGASLSYTSEFAGRVAAKVREDNDIFGTFSVMGFSLAGGSSPNSGLIFAPLKPVDERTKLGAGHDARSVVGHIFPQLFAIPGGIAFATEPPRHRRHRYPGRLPVHPPGLRPQYLHRHRPHRPHHGRRRRRAGLRTYPAQYHLHRQRSSAARHHRPRKGQGHRRASLPDHRGHRHLHGLQLHQRLRLQQPRLPRLRPGRSAVPPQLAGSSRLLRPHRRRRNGSSLQPRHGQRNLRPAGHQSLQHVPLGGDRRLARTRPQLRPGQRQHGQALPEDQAPRHDLLLDRPLA